MNSIRSRRRNRHKKKIRSCTECKHFWHYYHPGSHDEPPDGGWGCNREDEEAFMQLHLKLVDLEYRIAKEQRKTLVWTEEEWFNQYGKRCPMYQAFDRASDLAVQRIAFQKTSDTWRRSSDNLNHFGEDDV